MCTRLLKYSSEIGKPSIYYALAIMALHFFTSCLIATATIKLLGNTFSAHQVSCMFCLVMYGKEMLSFLSAPIVGALSDLWGRKLFLFISVFFTCAPIPFIAINIWWFLAMVTISGIFDVTFSVIHAYVADITKTENRSMAFGIVSATIGAIIIVVDVTPLSSIHFYNVFSYPGPTAAIIAVLNAIFIYFVVPESLPDNVRSSSLGTSMGWKDIHPFATIINVGLGDIVFMQCVAMMLIFMTETGKYTYFFAYLNSHKDYGLQELTASMVAIDVLSILALLLLGIFMRTIGAKPAIVVSLVIVSIQLFLYGIGNHLWVMFSAAILEALSAITYPAILAFISINSHADIQGVVLGILNGTYRLSYAVRHITFLIFSILYGTEANQYIPSESIYDRKMVYGALLVVIGIFVQLFIPAKPKLIRRTLPSSDIHSETEAGPLART